MNCSLANLTEAIGVVKFLVVASRFVMISMLARPEFSHFTHSLTMSYDFLDHFYVYMYQVSVFAFYRLHCVHKVWKPLGCNLDRTLQIARHSANGTL